MASNQMLVLLTAAVIILPAFTLAKTFTVGDESGWRTGFDYQKWAQGKKFKTGDKLVFKYSKGAHTVQKVDGNGFQNCKKPPKGEALTSGNDVVTLSTPGQKWYICGVGNHCAGGQKLNITVTGNALRTGSKKGSNNAARGIASSWVQVWVVVIVVGIVFMN